MPRPRFVYWRYGFFDVEEVACVVVDASHVAIYLKGMPSTVIQLDEKEAEAFLALPYFRENLMFDLRKEGGESAATN